MFLSYSKLVGLNYLYFIMAINLVDEVNFLKYSTMKFLLLLIRQITDSYVFMSSHYHDVVLKRNKKSESSKKAKQAKAEETTLTEKPKQ